MTARLRVRVQPGAKRAGLAGREADGALRVKVREPAREGKANDAVVALLAEQIGVPPSSVQVVRGAASRNKLIEVQGIEQDALEARIGGVLAGEMKRERNDDGIGA